MSDFDFDQDDFFEDYEEEAEESAEAKAKNDEPAEEVLSQAETEKRMAAFQQLQKRNMQIIVKPKQFKPEQRKEAVRWLGEAGDPTAVPALLKVYMKDKTPGMKEEAEYALGQIKAMGHALEDAEMQDEAEALFRGIVFYGKFGKRVDTGRFKMIEMGLAISAIVLVVLGVFAMFAVAAPKKAAAEAESAVTAAYETSVAPTPTPDNDETVQASLSDYYAALKSDANNYQFELLKAGRGESINCQPDFLNKPNNYTLTATWSDNADYVAIAAALNAVHDALAPVSDAYQESCNTQMALDQTTALDLGTTVLDVQKQLKAVETLFQDSGVEIPVIELATPTPQPTDIPEPTATPDLAAAEDTIIQLERIITDMTDPRGSATTLVAYWQQVASSNQMYREGCNTGSLTIPGEYTLPAELQGAFPDLDSAVQKINVGLVTLRESSDAFFAACADGNVPDNANDRLTQASFAKNTFTAAQVELDKLSGN